MDKILENEFKLVSSTDCVDEKLMILALYNEFYNTIINYFDDYSIIQYYQLLMEKTFELVVTNLDLHNDKISAEKFMKIYFQVLKKNRFFNVESIKMIIKEFDDNLNLFIETSEYVNVIDKFNIIPLDTKVNIMTQFREYINNMYIAIIELYGEENSKELRHKILNMLSIELNKYLESNVRQGYSNAFVTNKLKPTMMVNTKDYLITQLKNDSSFFEKFQDKRIHRFFDNFKEDEKKVLLMGIVYNISGYDKDDKLMKDKIIGEICESLGISKSAYMKIAASIGIVSLNEINKNIQIDGDIFDEKPSTK